MSIDFNPCVCCAAEHKPDPKLGDQFCLPCANGCGVSLAEIMTGRRAPPITAPVTVVLGDVRVNDAEPELADVVEISVQRFQDEDRILFATKAESSGCWEFDMNRAAAVTLFGILSRALQLVDSRGERGQSETDRLAIDRQVVDANLITWLAIHGNLSLALRHPSNTGPSRKYVADFVRAIGEKLVQRKVMTQEFLEEHYAVEQEAGGLKEGEGAP